MRTTRCRYWIYFLLLVFSGIAYVDRVNMSVAGKPIAQELGLSPVTDAGRAFAFLVLGGNVFGLLAPIITGYLVEATGSFNSAFIAAGVLALLGTAVTLALSRGAIVRWKW